MGQIATGILFILFGLIIGGVGLAFSGIGIGIPMIPIGIYLVFRGIWILIPDAVKAFFFITIICRKIAVNC